jgi:hypothetical protein
MDQDELILVSMFIFDRNKILSMISKITFQIVIYNTFADIIVDT